MKLLKNGLVNQLEEPIRSKADLRYNRSFGMTCFRDRKLSRRGSIIIFVMGMIFLLSMLLMLFLDQILPHIQMNTMKNSENDLRRVAYSSLEVTLAVLAEYSDFDGALYAPTQGWFDPLGTAGISFPDAEVSVRYLDETGKLPFSALYDNDVTFSMILTYLGFDDYTATALVDKFQDWVDEDDLVRPDGAEDDYYLDAPIPYSPPNQPLNSMRELGLVGGFQEEFFDIYGRPNQLYYSFESLFSAVNDGNVNINTADPILFTMGEEGMTFEQLPFWEYLSGEDGQRGTEDDRYFADSGQVPPSIGSAIPGVTIGNDIRWLRIIITARRGLSAFELNALVSLGGGLPGNLYTGFDRFRREEQVFSVADESERSTEIGNLNFPFAVVEIFEN